MAEGTKVKTIDIEWDGGTFHLNLSAIGLDQGIAIKAMTKDEQYPAGRSVGQWDEGCGSCDPQCMKALFWLMHDQAGDRIPAARIPGDLEIVALHSAYVAGAGKATALAEAEEEAGKKARSAATVVPIRRAEAPSSESGSPATTTPQPPAPQPAAELT